MGENKRRVMLRTVEVVGLVAMVALIITQGIVDLKPLLRMNTLKGQNILKIDLSDPAKRFHILGGYEKFLIDSDTGTYTLVLSTKSKYDSSEHRGEQGMYYGAGGDSSPKNYKGFVPGDKYYLTADIRTTSNVSLMSKVPHHMAFKSSKVEMAVNPAITNNWQHYETKGIRLDTWGAPVFAFTNDSGEPITIEIKNIKLIRED